MDELTQRLRQRAFRVFTTTQGDEIEYRRLHAEDVADLPDAWPIFNLAIYYALRKDETAETEQSPWVKEYDAATTRFDEHARNKIVLVCRAATNPPIYDPKHDSEPENGAPYYALSQLDLNRFVNDIIIHASGLEPSAQEEEAQRIRRFPDGTSVPASDAGDEAGGDERGGVLRDTAPVEGNGVETSGGVLGPASKAGRDAQTDA